MPLKIKSNDEIKFLEQYSKEIQTNENISRFKLKCKNGNWEAYVRLNKKLDEKVIGKLKIDITKEIQERVKVESFSIKVSSNPEKLVEDIKEKWDSSEGLMTIS